MTTEYSAQIELIKSQVSILTISRSRESIRLSSTSDDISIEMTSDRSSLQSSDPKYRKDTKSLLLTPIVERSVEDDNFTDREVVREALHVIAQ